MLPLLTAISTVLDAIRVGGHRGLPRLRHPARRDPRAEVPRPRLRRRPRLRQRVGPPGRRGARVFRLQRAIQERGFHTYRYSGAAFRIDVKEGDGVVRGLDVFAGFIDESAGGSRLYLMGEVGADFRREWVYPRHVLHAGGPHVPGPGRARSVCSRRCTARAGRCPTRRSSSRRPSGPSASSPAGSAVRRPTGPPGSAPTAVLAASCPTAKPSPLARKAASSCSSGGTVIDVGAGRGADSLWLARQGLSVRAYDYVPSAAQAVQQAADGRGPRPRRADAQPQRVAHGAGRGCPDVPRRGAAGDDRPPHGRRDQPLRRAVAGAVRVDVAARRRPALPRRVDRGRAARPTGSSRCRSTRSLAS